MKKNGHKESSPATVFSVIPNPRWFVINDARPCVPLQRFPEGCTSWELAERIIAESRFGKLPIEKCTLDKWSLKYGMLPEGFHALQGYALAVSEGKIVIGCKSLQGYYNGIHTLSQLAVQADGSLPDIRIIDWPDMDVRCAHICYHLAMDWMPESVPNFDSLLELVKKLANFKYNAILLEIESMFPYTTDPAISAGDAFNKEQIKRLVSLCENLKIEIIPLLQCLGHAYHVLRLPQFAHLRETVDTNQQYCPSNPGVYPFYMKLADELISAFGDVKKFHIGGDESRRLGICPECSRTAEGKGVGVVYGRHVGKVAGGIAKKGITPLVWSDMVEHHPDALEHLPPKTEIVYWKYSLPAGHDRIDFGKFGSHPVWAAAGVRFGRCNHTMYLFESAVQGIAFLAGEAKRMNCRKWIVTDWMKGIPYELSSMGMAYGSEAGWSGGRSMNDFAGAYTDIVFGAKSHDWWRVYSYLEPILPYCEDAQAGQYDGLDRYDLSGLAFKERIAKYTLTRDRGDVRGRLKEGLESAGEAKKLIINLRGRLKRGEHEWEMLNLSAETNAHKARLGLTIDEAVCLLKFPVQGSSSRYRRIAEEIDNLVSEHDALRKKTGKLLRKGMITSHAAALLDVKFEPDARKWMEYFREALRNGDFLPSVLSR